MENPAPLVPRGKRHELLGLRRQSVKFYKTFPKLFQEAVNEDLALENERLREDKRVLQKRISQLRDAQDEMEHDMMTTCWNEHGPYQLREAIGVFNRGATGLVCGCANCIRQTDREDELPVTNTNCFLFERLRDVMASHEITFAIDNPFASVREVTPGFCPIAASPYLHVVSDLDVHLVFPDPYNDPYRVYYGRKLWDVLNPCDDIDIERLTHFQKRLHHKPLVVPHADAPYPGSPSAEP